MSDIQKLKEIDQLLNDDVQLEKYINEIQEKPDEDNVSKVIFVICFNSRFIFNKKYSQNTTYGCGNTYDKEKCLPLPSLLKSVKHSENKYHCKKR